MKTIKYIIITLLLVGQVGCIDKKFEDQFKVTIDTDLFNQIAVIQVFDPSGQSNLEGDTALSVEVLGDDKDKVVTDAGENISKLKIIDGVVNLVVNPNKNIENNPVEVLLKISGDNYLTTTVPVTIGIDERTEVSAYVVNKTSPVDGIEREEKTASIKNGVSEEQIVIETEIVNQTKNKAKVSIDVGTQFQDINGNLIEGDEVELEVTNFSPTNIDALTSFPGGFSPQSVTLDGGEVVNDVAFVTAGFVSVDMEVGGVEVKNFSKAITITMSVDTGSMNPDTGELVKLGDVIPIWSYSKDNGQWDYHGDSEVVMIDGKLQVEYTTTHLSWYNMDFYGRRCSRYSWWGDSSNGTPVTLQLSLPGVSSSDSRRLLSTFVYEGTSQEVSYNATKTQYWYDGQTFELNNTPAGRNLQLVVYSGDSRYNRGEEIFRSPAFDGCAGGQVNIDASSMVSKLPPAPIRIHVKYSGECNDRIIRPSTHLYMFNETYNYWQYKGYIYRGEITLHDMELNKPYSFRVYYNGRRHEHTITFDKTEYIDDNYNIPDELCNQL
ncbi:hypothetical protein FHR24_000014 [Wenyingzhuangia heitensis]|uniref:Uncharacterized protein n=1 Tax=Wenyingzhuangia heitensis TaxID=1487859 RepID=A0ABX0U3W5_9FLAO|nr:hypothetical protein [Wenyingzhuangia heitensis]NIJ43575.1 hypothetical protein [Wenyingzhuangia heitensis]